LSAAGEVVLDKTVTAAATGAVLAEQGFEVAKEKIGHVGEVVLDKTITGAATVVVLAGQGFEAAKEKIGHGYEVAKDKIEHLAHEGYESAKVNLAHGYEVAKDKAVHLGEDLSQAAQHGAEVGLEKLAQGYEIAKESLIDISGRLYNSTLYYWGALKEKFDKFTHITQEDYERAKAKLADIKRETNEIIAHAKEKGIVLSEEFLTNTQAMFEKQETELEEMALKVKENLEKQQGQDNLKCTTVANTPASILPTEQCIKSDEACLKSDEACLKSDKACLKSKDEPELPKKDWNKDKKQQGMKKESLGKQEKKEEYRSSNLRGGGDRRPAAARLDFSSVAHIGNEYPITGTKEKKDVNTVEYPLTGTPEHLRKLGAPVVGSKNQMEKVRIAHDPAAKRDL